jgi:hypothetical protein
LRQKSVPDLFQGFSLRLYSTAAAYAQERGIIIADTKFEFGLDNTGKLYLIDWIILLLVMACPILLQKTDYCNAFFCSRDPKCNVNARRKLDFY